MTRHDIARQIAEGSIVMLKNEGDLLPLETESHIAVFGRTQLDTIYSGNGSGASAVKDQRSILSACERAGLQAEPKLKAWYEEQYAHELTLSRPGIDWSHAAELVHSGVMYELFGQYHAPIPEYMPDLSLLEDARAFTDTALFVLGRNAGGEECDRYLENDYLLSAAEKQLIDQICGVFSKVVLIVNSNGPVDLSWTEALTSIRSILFIGIPGEAGSEALANILTGRVSPSGKLAMTFARKYNDYPSARHFSYDKNHPEHILTYTDYGLDAAENGSTGFSVSPVTVYAEGLFMGYRGFDSLNIQPMYPFGFGLSYTRFEILPVYAEKQADGILVIVQVTNSGCADGREVVQVYTEYHGGDRQRPLRELAAFAKTRLLHPGKSQRMVLTVPWRALACYCEETAAWQIDKAVYTLHVGNSSRNTVPAVMLRAERTLLVEKCSNLLSIKECNKKRIQFSSRSEIASEPDTDCRWTFTLSPSDLVLIRPQSPGKIQIPKVVQEMSIEELAALCVGFGPGTPFSGISGSDDPKTIPDAQGKPLTCNSHPTGMNGYVSPAMLDKGIYSVSYQDGPAGVGGIAWPTAMLMACSFDIDLCYLFGDTVGAECEERQIDVWLAPAVNLQRHPLGGRNFEYYSEDPYLTGVCACAIAKGVEENHPVKVCAKHFASNEQETFRRGSSRKNIDAADSVVTERFLRELYLLPFEVLVKDAHISLIMTSFNKINGIFAGGNADLCTRLLRDEWRFSGLVVTDWGDMDVVVDGADAIEAGNDVVMPGGPPVIQQILKGYSEGRVHRNSLEKAVTHLLGITMQHKRPTSLPGI